MRRFQSLGGSIGLTICLAVLAGCQHDTPHVGTPPAIAADSEPAPKLTSAQTADLKIAYARTLEKKGADEPAEAAYLDALKLDPARSDACARLAVIYDGRGQFGQSAAMYYKALAGLPKSADVHCNFGYSLYLQGNMADAESRLREALAIAPDHTRAHNNLGLILARAGRCDEALAEFRRAGCKEEDAQVNLAYALTLERRWPEARACYERALAANPNSNPARAGLRELDCLLLETEARRLIAPRPNESSPQHVNAEAVINRN
jgi:Tfp pilus assembly protein PilF